MIEPFRYVRHNRSPRAIGILGLVYAALAAAVIWFDAAWWLVAIPALFTLPALWDLYTDSRAGLSLDDGVLAWFSGRRTGTMALADVDYFRFDTRWDFSVRVTVFPRQGKPVRLPYEALPPHRAFETELLAREMRVDRHHFVIF